MSTDTPAHVVCVTRDFSAEKYIARCVDCGWEFSSEDADVVETERSKHVGQVATMSVRAFAQVRHELMTLHARVKDAHHTFVPPEGHVCGEGCESVPDIDGSADVWHVIDACSYCHDREVECNENLAYPCPTLRILGVTA